MEESSETSSTSKAKKDTYSPVTTEKEQEDRWTGHFREILNRDPPLNPIETQEDVEDLYININPPTKTENPQAR